MIDLGEDGILYIPAPPDPDTEVELNDKEDPAEWQEHDRTLLNHRGFGVVTLSLRKDDSGRRNVLLVNGKKVVLVPCGSQKELEEILEKRVVLNRKIARRLEESQSPGPRLIPQCWNNFGQCTFDDFKQESAIFLFPGTHYNISNDRAVYIEQLWLLEGYWGASEFNLLDANAWKHPKPIFVPVIS